ncbi:MAG: hypothetical protein ACTSRC_12645 [Candidatus Helarchaeota archaeon]
MGWVNELFKKKIPVKLFTTINHNQLSSIRTEWPQKGQYLFIPCFEFLDKLIVYSYFSFQFLKNKLTIIHLKKRSPKIFRKLKWFFKNFIIIIEREGDFIYEKDYLISHPYKNGFYSETLKYYDIFIERDKSELQEADFIICVSENLKNLYISRYKLNKEKIIVVGTGVNSQKFSYNSERRKKFRTKLGISHNFVLIYIGNIFYSWQNISRTLEVYKIIKNIQANAILIIITRKTDEPIIIDFLRKHNIPLDGIILRFSIQNHLIPYYLNAADLGIILRENHPMNQVAAPGKFGEYACCGLPILTGCGLSNFSEKLNKTPYGIVLENVYDDEELKNKFGDFLENYRNLDRSEISRWGKSNFSYEAYSNAYLSLIKKLLKS